MMKGVFHVRISTKKLVYDFDVKRKITIIRGNSGTGKTTLVDIVTQSKNKGVGTGIQIISKVECTTIIDVNNTWKNQIESISNNIIFIDESEDFTMTNEFARVVSKSDNYFVLVTRSKIESLPYSVNEIYEISTSGKYHTLANIYEPSKDKFIPDMIITEDSGSGYEFFLSLCGLNENVCISAYGKSNIGNKLTEVIFENKSILIVADGSAFGSNIEHLLKLSKFEDKFKICVLLPESFEYLLLRSEIFKNDKRVQKILANPYDYIDTSYMSWERYFTKLLTQITAKTPAMYSKTKLSACYTQNCCAKGVSCQFMIKDTGKNKGVGKIDLVINDIKLVDFSKLR